MMTAAQLINIAKAGGSLVVDASNFAGSQLVNIAKAGNDKGTKLIVKNANRLMSSTCINVASASPGNVTFDFSE